MTRVLMQGTINHLQVCPVLGGTRLLTRGGLLWLCCWWYKMEPPMLLWSRRILRLMMVAPLMRTWSISIHDPGQERR